MAPTASSLFSPLRPLTLASLVLSLLTALLLLSAAASPTFTSSGGYQFGAFRVCYPGDSCHTINTKCEITYQGFTGPIFDDDDCNKLQAVRAFLIMALLVSFVVTALTLYMFVSHRMAQRALNMAVHALMGVQWFFVLIAWSVAAALLRDASKGDAFGCLVSAWVIGMLAWALWAAAGRFEEEGVRGLGGSGMAGGAPSKAVESNSSVSTTQRPDAAGIDGQQPPAPYGGQPTYQPSYQHQPYATQPQPIQSQPQYAPQQYAVSAQPPSVQYGTTSAATPTIPAESDGTTH